ncbi:hypothetical protein CTAYLR_010392 [Chrysophaeum taylorii]|uniref:histidine kinase n=1 Tax=Chrysophaeum taylorii TaxID=2483200 RepID=A0AAD7UP24_9STRA|nr:hypothetical protein CTAYLR_010392 [Chrysophaeum taylorii]
MSEGTAEASCGRTQPDEPELEVIHGTSRATSPSSMVVHDDAATSSERTVGWELWTMGLAALAMSAVANVLVHQARTVHRLELELDRLNSDVLVATVSSSFDDSSTRRRLDDALDDFKSNFVGVRMWVTRDAARDFGDYGEAYEALLYDGNAASYREPEKRFRDSLADVHGAAVFWVALLVGATTAVFATTAGCWWLSGRRRRRRRRRLGEECRRRPPKRRRRLLCDIVGRHQHRAVPPLDPTRLLEGLPPAFVIDEAMRVVSVNGAAASTFGFDESDLINRPITLALDLDDLAQETLFGCRTSSTSSNESSEYSHRNASGGRRREVDVKGQTKLGKELHIVAHATRTLDTVTGERLCTIVCHDVTQLVGKAEELEIQKKVLLQFAHEMRNKYTPAASMLEQILLSLKGNKSVGEIVTELASDQDDIKLSIALLREADALIATRLELHKVYAGKYASEPNTATCDIWDLMSSKVSAAGVLAPSGVRFAALMPDGYDNLRVVVELDTYIFTHITNSLLFNARKHTKSGSVALSFVKEDKGSLEFAVIDTGTGVPASIACRLFREDVASGAVRGVGLGLISCKHFAAAIGGDCWLESTAVQDLCDGDTTKPHGTEFRFKLPGKVVQALSSSSSSNGAPDPTPEGRGTAVVVDEQERFDQDVASPNFRPSQQTHFAGALPRVMTIYVVEDSMMIRRSIVTKLTALCRRIDGEFTFHEHATVESILPQIDGFAHNANVLVTVDENLDTTGGKLRGSALVTALVDVGFLGVIVSASGDEANTTEHLDRGADLAWGKPLPTSDEMLETLCRTYNQKIRKNRPSLPRGGVANASAPIRLLGQRTAAGQNNNNLPTTAADSAPPSPASKVCSSKWISST